MASQENPYQSPESIDNAAPLRRKDAYGRSVWPYASGHARAVWAISSLAATIVLVCLSVGFMVVGLQAWHQMLDGATNEFDSAMLRLTWVGRVLQWLAYLLFAVFLPTSITFLMWIHRIHKNLPALRAGHLKYSPGWAVGCFFIPILNLIQPYLVMREIWRESDPARLMVSAEASGSTKPSSAASVGWWWGLFLVANVANHAPRQFKRINTFAPFVHIDTSSPFVMLWLCIAVEAIAIAAAIAAIVLIYRVDAHQSQRYAIVLQQSDATAISPSGTSDIGLVH